MFGSKKNIGQKITEAYQQAHAENDLGRKLLALDALKDKVDRLLEKPAYKRSPIGKIIFSGLGYGAAGGAIVGSMIAPGLAEIALSGMVGLIPGLLGGAVYDLGINDMRAQKRLERQIIKQSKEIYPHEAVLQQVLKQIKEDQNDIVRIENAEELKLSLKFDMLIKKRPALADLFRQAQKGQTVAEIPRKPDSRKKPAQENKLSL